MSNNALTIVGLGPGRRDLLTVEALDALRAAHRIYLRAADQAIVAALRDDLRSDALIRDFDVDTSDEEIVAALLRETAEGPLVYAISGHPLAGHPSVRLLLDRVRESGLSLRIVAGLSGIEQSYAQLSFDPLAAGVQIVDAARISPNTGSAEEGLYGRWTAASMRLLDAQIPLLITGIDGDGALARVKEWLLGRYPSAHTVIASGAGDGAAHEAHISLQELDWAALAENGAVLLVPPLAALDDARAPNTLGYITARLRGPGGCPWDREQTHASLTPYMIEEAYEAVDAIERDDDVDMVEELGDVLLQVVLHSQLAEEEGRFSLADVAEEVNRKLVRRHPHVFGDVEVSGSSEVLRNWEKIKRVEKGERRTSALDGIPPALPALLLAQTIGRKAAKTGFDWPDVAGTLDKAREEIDEIARATSEEERREEMGDLLFALTSVCRHLGVDAEDALRAAVRKFSARFRRVEGYARTRGLDLAAMHIDALEELWQESKREERNDG